MAIKPILFSGPMVRALLDGRKTMTRRVLKDTNNGVTTLEEDGELLATNDLDEWVARPLPYAPGDLLYCREGFTTKNEGSRATPRLVPMYAADFEGFNKPDRDWSWSPSIHMPRKFSRITLEVTAVKVERVASISGQDCAAEGIQFTGIDDGPTLERGIGIWRKHQVAFRHLWDSLNAKRGYGWDANPWVAAISFKVHHANVDSLKEAA